MFLTACDSAEPRAGDEDYTDASTGAKESSSTKSKDAGSKEDDKVKTADGKKESGQAGDKNCGDKSCSAPAKCEDNSRCVCPEGYDDVKGDGSECKDIDECKDHSAKCGKGAGCKNTPGGYECMCNGPAYEKDGDECKCAEGYKRDDEGYCVGQDGKACSDGLDCENNHCEGGICCALSCAAPGECHVTDGAKCSDDGKSCVYPVAKDGASCDDGKACTRDGTCKAGKCEESKEPTKCDDGNPCTDDSCEEPTGCRNQNNEATCDDGSACTSGDKCVGGTCKGGNEPDCSGSADACNVGACDPKTGQCVKEARKTSAMCDDANSCTTGDSCKDGVCTGANACGANATECTPGSAGEVNMCACKDGFVAFQGRCVPMNDECQKSNPCSPDADCIDPSNTDGDLTCACRPGFSGDGKQCKQTDPCATNPCGMGGTCANDNQGGYTCTCAAGTRLVNGKCGCDLSGTFGLRATQTVSWKDVDQFVEDGVVQSLSYVIQKHTYDADGNLKVEITECGGTSYDLCSVAFPPFLGAEAYGQYVPDAVWQTPSMPRTNITINLPESQPGAAFKTDLFSMLSGIQLDDPRGEWPADRTKVAGTSDASGTPVNGAKWLDPDNDGSLGLTTYAIGPGGEKADGVPPDPPMNYGADSQECPRSNDGPRSPYAYPPAIPNGSLAVQRIKRVYGASRLTLSYDGKVDSCDAISGTLTGPDNGQMRLEGRVIGCVRVNGDGESACGAAAVDFLDKQPQTQKTTDAKFKLKRMPDNATCKDVWTASFD